MSNAGSDDFSRFDTFADLGEDDFAQIDAATHACTEHEKDHDNSDNSFPLPGDGFIDFSNLTEEDYAEIDSIVQMHLQNESAEPGITVQIEHSNKLLNDEAGYLNVPRRRSGRSSPFQRFRSKIKTLSVTDLVAPVWCEVQFDYGLLGMRTKPVEKRPKTFISSTGKQIVPDKSISVENDKTTKGGRAVHKKLEREIRAEEVQIVISSEEERWALRLINMMSCLNDILMTGFTREMPLFGTIQGEVVIGIVDEVVRHVAKPNSNKREGIMCRISSPLKRQRRNRTPSPSQASIDEFFMNNSMSKEPKDDQRTFASSSSMYSLHIIDTKSRMTDSLPPPEDTVSSQLQLMIYQRLLSTLVSQTSPFDFTSFWKILGINASRHFSTKFLIQTSLIDELDDIPKSSLNDLVEFWRRMIHKSNFVGVDPMSEIIYRLQPSTGNRALRRQGTELESVELQRTIEASLKDSGSSKVTSSDNVMEIIPAQKSELVDIEDIYKYGTKAIGSNQEIEDTNPLNAQVNGNSHAKIIGTKLVEYSGSFLDDHITDILLWWHGFRRPRGVPLELSRRCNTCEYNKSCEWRETKALEMRGSA